MPVKILADSENIRPIFGKEKPRTMARSKKIMIITFIHHSSFLVETDSLYLLFDYFRGTLPELDPAKPLYVLTSHSHSDHYSRKIFSLTDRRMAKGTDPVSLLPPVEETGPAMPPARLRSYIRNDAGLW